MLKELNIAMEEYTAENSHVYTKKESNVKESTLIDDCSEPATSAVEESNHPSITNYDKEGYVSRTLERGPSKGENNIQEEGYGHETSQGDCEILGIDKGKILKTGPVAENVQHKNEESGISRIESHGNISVAIREEGLTNATGDISMKASTSELQKMLGSEERDEQTEDGCSNAGSFMNLKQHEEVAFVTSKRNVLCTEAGDKASESEKSKKRRSKNPAKKIEPSDPAYMEGTNDVTKSIVHLWREYREILGYSKLQIEQRGSRNLTKDEVNNKLKFSTDELKMPDEKGYDALLKACSLPSMSPRVMQYLISERKIDVNCQLPSDFDTHHPTAKGLLIPGMSALSVAIRNGNAKSISTFMTQRDKIKDGIKSADKEGNSALHHCVLSISKGPFMELFPILEPSEWIEVRNKPKDGKKGKNPLEIAQEMKSSEELSTVKAQYLQEMLDKMKPNTSSSQA